MKTKVQLKRKTATSIRTENGFTSIRYHATDVIQFNDNQIILNNGGWMTATTKARINQASDDYGLGIGIAQRNFEWFVMLKNPKFKRLNNEPYWLPDSIPFVNGMTFARKHFGNPVVPFLPIVGMPAKA